MRKGLKLLKVDITKNKVIVYANDGSKVKLSRTERNALSNYKNPGYIDDIKKIFGNNDVFENGFTIVKNGETKLTYTK